MIRLNDDSLSFNEMAQAGPPARRLVQTHHLLRQRHNLSVINLRASRPRASQQHAKQPVSYRCAFCRDFRDFLQLFSLMAPCIRRKCASGAFSD